MRISEVYASVQGEGPNVGEKTVFTRFAGCNLRCPGWPCDTQHAIDPKYREQWYKITPEDLRITVWNTARLAGATTITLTGGEPFLQKDSELQSLVEELQYLHKYRIEAFTNGTLPYPDWAIDRVSMIMDWKLPGSGEDTMNKTRMENVEKLSRSPLPQAVKFVCKDMHDMITAHALWSVYLEGTGIIPYYGKVWDGKTTDAKLVEYVMQEQLPWKLNVQLHNYIWPANERGR